jgi:glycogen debranching enzyme
MSSKDGQVREGFDGLYAMDRRFLRTLVVTVDREQPVSLAGGAVGAGGVVFVGALYQHTDNIPDPSIMCTRWRSVDENGGREHIRITNRLRRPMTMSVEVQVASDLAPLGDVQGELQPPLVPATVTGNGLHWRADSGYACTVTASVPARIDADAGTMRWSIVLGSGSEWTVELQVSTEAPPLDRPQRPKAPAAWSAAPLRVEADDRRVARFTEQSLADLSALRLTQASDPEPNEFLAAGSPWFLTLFGRDALWSAMLALPLGPELAVGTLATLARRQGQRADPETDEAKGKILHEQRLPATGVWKHPIIYGSIDATPLFVIAAAEAWRWGASALPLSQLLPAVESALDWLVDSADADGDGFVEYEPNRSTLANQGWKDSYDAIQW